MERRLYVMNESWCMMFIVTEWISVAQVYMDLMTHMIGSLLEENDSRCRMYIGSERIIILDDLIIWKWIKKRDVLMVLNESFK